MNLDFCFFCLSQWRLQKIFVGGAKGEGADVYFGGASIIPWKKLVKILGGAEGGLGHYLGGGASVYQPLPLGATTAIKPYLEIYPYF